MTLTIRVQLVEDVTPKELALIMSTMKDEIMDHDSGAVKSVHIIEETN